MMSESPELYLFQTEIQEYLSEKADEIATEIKKNYQELDIRVNIVIYYRNSEGKGNGKRKS